MPNGDILAGGDFSLSTDTTIRHLARFDGTSWRPIGPPLNGPVHALALLPGGDLIIAGAFTNAGNNSAANYLARFDGNAWHACAGLNAPVTALALTDSSHLIVGGEFTDAGGQPFADHLARWNGTAWKTIGTGITFDDALFSDTPSPWRRRINALAITPTGAIAVGGYFHSAGADCRASSMFALYHPQLPRRPPPPSTSGHLILYPNPARHTVQLTGTTAPTVEILDPLGRPVRHFPTAPLPRPTTLDLRGLAPGLYLVRCGNQSRRLAVE